VPAGHSAYVTGVSFGVGQGKECTFKGKFRNGFGGAFSVKYALTLYQNTYFGPIHIPLKVPEKTDMVITAQAGGAGVTVDASWGMIIKKEQQ